MLIRYAQYLFLLHSPTFHIHITPVSFMTLYYRILCIQTHNPIPVFYCFVHLPLLPSAKFHFSTSNGCTTEYPPLISCKICHKLYLILSKRHSTPIPQFHAISDSHTLSYTAYSLVSISLDWELLIHICLQLLQQDRFLFMPASCAFQQRLLDNYIYQLPGLLPSHSPYLGRV